MYGVLNATYIQQESILKLYKLANVPNPKVARAKIRSLRIRELRHKLGAHSINHLGSTYGKPESYVPVLMSLSRFKCEYFNNQTLTLDRVDLCECLNEHCEILIDFMDEVYEKTAKTLFKAEEKKLQKHMEKLKELRKARKCFRKTPM